MRLPDLPVPEVTEGTVLVKAQAAALNPVDNALAAGTMAQLQLTAGAARRIQTPVPLRCAVIRLDSTASDF